MPTLHTAGTVGIVLICATIGTATSGKTISTCATCIADHTAVTAWPTSAGFMVGLAAGTAWPTSADFMVGFMVGLVAGTDTAEWARNLCWLEFGKLLAVIL